MSSHAYATPLIVEPRPSRRLRAAWLGVMAAAGSALLVLPLAWALMAGMALMLAAVLERPGRTSRGRLEWRADGHWRVATPAGRQSARLLPGTYCSRWLVVLVLAAGRRRIVRVLLPDVLDPVTWRRLRVRLRIEGPDHAGDPGAGQRRTP